ncbi:uncharacterized protein LOC124941732 [Impatiens glandulifera]|uniref:uncharacterized protein LOC124941732 n=1 Tax=Impatiens glandulifera TaxID=253017 RepID=UPI001FB0D40F|nr:uncharacterized protein LOC124941732 [Impatiens glandulifera]
MSSAPIVTSLMVEREETVMPPSRGGQPIRRKARFLLPSLNVEETSPTIMIPHSSNTVPNDEVFFDGWRKCTARWEQWVSQMRPLYQPIWERAGIAEAITGSLCTIAQQKEVILELSDRWCSETKSFIFPWGEATVTLEDVAAIGGFSLGDFCVLKPLETPDLKEIEDVLIAERREIVRSKAARACQKLWMDKFMDSGSDIEHEAFPVADPEMFSRGGQIYSNVTFFAFLSFWLSRFVFTGPAIDTVRANVFPIAVHLSRATRIALAPAVLASLYRDLDLLKRREQRSTRKPSKSRSANKITIWAPFQLVQVWIWERFESLRPQGIRTVGMTEPRICRWHIARTEGLVNENIGRVFDESGKKFVWRPYTSRDYKGFMSELYGKKVERVFNTYLDREVLEDFVRCIRVSELVGVEVDCIEQYLPHRVGMQFGFDQDIPVGQVAREDGSSETAWRNYARPIVDHVINVPTRLYEPEITTRYYRCWKRSIRIHLGRPPRNRNEVQPPVVNQERTRTDGVMIQPPTRDLAASSSSAHLGSTLNVTRDPLPPPTDRALAAAFAAAVAAASSSSAHHPGTRLILIRDPLPPPPGFSSRMIYALDTQGGVIPLPFRPPHQP